MTMTKDDLVIGGKYNWKSQPERLVYVGKSGWSWYQFALVSEPSKVWCEVLAGDLHMMERTNGN